MCTMGFLKIGEGQQHQLLLHTGHVMRSYGSLLDLRSVLASLIIQMKFSSIQQTCQVLCHVQIQEGIAYSGHNITISCPNPKLPLAGNSNHTAGSLMREQCRGA